MKSDAGQPLSLAAEDPGRQAAQPSAKKVKKLLQDVKYILKSIKIIYLQERKVKL